jgi:hypothetical protein
LAGRSSGIQHAEGTALVRMACNAPRCPHPAKCKIFKRCMYQEMGWRQDQHRANAVLARYIRRLGCAAFPLIALNIAIRAHRELETRVTRPAPRAHNHE